VFTQLEISGVDASTTGNTPVVHARDAPSNLAMFSYTSKCQIFQDFLSHRIFGRMREALNINKK